MAGGDSHLKTYSGGRGGLGCGTADAPQPVDKVPRRPRRCAEGRDAHRTCQADGVAAQSSGSPGADGLQTPPL